VSALGWSECQGGGRTAGALCRPGLAGSSDQNTTMQMQSCNSPPPTLPHLSNQETDISAGGAVAGLQVHGSLLV
jgi:hypothetical protein